MKNLTLIILVLIVAGCTNKEQQSQTKIDVKHLKHVKLEVDSVCLIIGDIHRKTEHKIKPCPCDGGNKY